MATRHIPPADRGYGDGYCITPGCAAHPVTARYRSRAAGVHSRYGAIAASGNALAAPATRYVAAVTARRRQTVTGR